MKNNINNAHFVLHGDFISTVCGIVDILEEAEELKRRQESGEKLCYQAQEKQRCTGQQHITERIPYGKESNSKKFSKHG